MPNVGDQMQRMFTGPKRGEGLMGYLSPCPTPGRKIRSKGKGRGLARGRGRGPVGIPGGRSRGQGRGLGRGWGTGVGNFSNLGI